MPATVDRKVEAFVAAPRQPFIDGQWTDAASGRPFDTPNPATGETLARVAEGDVEDIDRAVRAARRVFEEGPWARMTPSEPSPPCCKKTPCAGPARNSAS